MRSSARYDTPELEALHDVYVANVNALLADDREADAYELVREFEADAAAVRLRQRVSGHAAYARGSRRTAGNRYRASTNSPR